MKRGASALLLGVVLAAVGLVRVLKQREGGGGAMAAPPVVATPSKPTAAPPEPAAPREALTTQAISKQVARSVVSLRCAGVVGSGFFIEPELLITNAHVACPGKVPIIVTLPDGRKLLGVVKARDAWADVAQVEVAGAEATPLAIGDTTRLEPGDKLVFIGSPSGLAFTVHEGTVSFAGRNYLGLAYVQLNASVNPGNSGGPLLNDKGEVLGIVSMKVDSTDGIGLALPIEYARAPAEPEALARWSKILARVKEEDAAEQANELAELSPGKPRLVGTRSVDGQGAAAIVMERWTGTPHTLIHDFTLEQRGSAPCAVRASVSRWTTLEDAIAEQPETRRLAWLLKNHLAAGVYLGAGVLEPVDCPAAALTGEATLVLRLGNAERGRATVNAAALRVPGDLKRATDANRSARDAVAAQTTARDEAQWRARYSAARQKLARIEQEAETARDQMDQADKLVLRTGRELTVQSRQRYERLKEQVARSAAEVADAKAELHELDRQAANEAVPFEWRR